MTSSDKTFQPSETRYHESTFADVVDAALPQVDDVVDVDVDAAQPEPEPRHHETPPRRSGSSNLEQRPTLLPLRPRSLQPLVDQADRRLLASAHRRLGSGCHQKRSQDPIHLARRCHRRRSLSSEGLTNASEV